QGWVVTGRGGAVQVREGSVPASSRPGAGTQTSRQDRSWHHPRAVPPPAPSDRVPNVVHSGNVTLTPALHRPVPESGMAPNANPFRRDGEEQRRAQREAAGERSRASG